MKKTIVKMPGDGIGKVVLEEAIRVIEKAGFEANYVEGDIGWDFWCKEGNPLPQRTLDLIEEHRIGLFGAITSKPKEEAFNELSDKLKNSIESKHGSKILKFEKWADRKLAYTINDHKNGTYHILETDCNSECIKDVEVADIRWG